MHSELGWRSAGEFVKIVLPRTFLMTVPARTPRAPDNVNLPETKTASEPAESTWVSALKWTDDGLVPAIVQDVETGDVLMMAWMDESALRRTLESGQTHFYSRSRRSAWHKGGTSGHVQDVESVSVDCDADVLLLKVRQVGGACHEGYRSCFFRRVGSDGRLEIVARPVFEAEAVYGPKSQEGVPPSGV